MAIESNNAPPAAVTVPAPDFPERCRAWHVALEHYNREADALDGRLAAVGPRPVFPEILTQPLRAIDGTERQAPRSPRHNVDRAWSVQDLDVIIEKGGFLESELYQTATVIGTSFSVRPLSEDELDTVRQMAEAARKYHQDFAESCEACSVIENGVSDLLTELVDEAVALIAEPVEALADVRQKIAIIKILHELGLEHDEMDSALGQMMANLDELLTGQARAAA